VKSSKALVNIGKVMVVIGSLLALNTLVAMALFTGISGIGQLRTWALVSPPVALLAGGLLIYFGKRARKANDKEPE